MINRITWKIWTRDNGFVKFKLIILFFEITKKIRATDSLEYGKQNLALK